MKRVHIYKEPPSEDLITVIARSLPQGVRTLVSTRGQKYRELGMANQTLTDDEWLELIKKEPRLLRRPILTDGRQALVGFDEDAYRVRIRGDQ